MASYQMQRQVWTRSARHAQTTAACLTSTRSFTSLPPRLHQEGRNFAPSTTTNDFSAIPQQPFAQPPPKPPRRRIGLVSSVIFLLLGGALSAGRHIEDYLPKPAVPGSPEDEKRRARVRQEAEKLPLVQQLMANPAYTHHEAYTSYTEDPSSHAAARLTTGPLGGSSGIGAYQHIFHNTKEEEVLNVIFFGDAVWGWPSVVHGGLIATILDEHSARGALADSAIREQGKGVLTARLEISYQRPVRSPGFYLVRAQPVKDVELPVADRGKRDRKIWVNVQIEGLDGQVHVKAKSLFVVPKGTQLRAIPDNF